MCTLLKASVYSIVLQQQIWNESEEDHQQRQQQEEQGYQGEDWEVHGEEDDVSIG